MPELPEVETIRRDLAAFLVGRRFLSVQIMEKKGAGPSAAAIMAQLPGRKITALDRRGKLLIFRLSGRRGCPGNMLVHLKMTGQLIYEDGRRVVGGGHSLSAQGRTGLAAAVGGDLPNKHTRAIFSFTGGSRLYFNDLRKFGYLRLADEAELQDLLAKNYGPEPLTPAFTVQALITALSGRKISVKAALLNQRLVAGLGNIYVDEALYAAGIRPERSASSLKQEEVKVLHREIQRLIKWAVKERGTTFSDYLDSSGRRGNFSRFLQVYSRGGQDCRRCGQKIKKIKLAGRGTHYCPVCQI